MSRAQFPQTLAALEQAVHEKVAPGFVAGLWSLKQPEIYHVVARGERRWIPSPQSLSSDTVFDLASVTKVYGTATLTALLIEQGKLRWDTSVSDIIHGYPFPEIRLRHLLSHTAGFIAWQPLWEMLQAKFAPVPIHSIAVAERQRGMREIVLSIAPEVTVESRALYSDISFLLLGFVIEEVSGLPLDRAVSELLWQPLGLSSTYRHVKDLASNQRDETVAATEDSEWRGGVLQGQVHDDNTWAMGGYAGHAGAFGTARDVLFFAKRLMEGYLPLSIRDAMWKRVDWPLGCERALGWDTPAAQGSMVGVLMSRRSVGHWGFTGTSLWIDLEREIAVTLLSNRVHPTRDNNLIRLLRPKFHDALISDWEALNTKGI